MYVFGQVLLDTAMPAVLEHWCKLSGYEYNTSGIALEQVKSWLLQSLKQKALFMKHKQHFSLGATLNLIFSERETKFPTWPGLKLRESCVIHL